MYTLRCVHNSHARSTLWLAVYILLARSVTSHVQAAMRLGEPPFEVPPLCRAAQPTTPADSAVCAWGHQIVHIVGAT